jgi:excisionase family DNA binding protein
MGQIQEIRQPEEGYVGVDEVAVYLSVSKGHVRKMVQRGMLPAKQVGFGKKRYWRFKMSEIRQKWEQTA